MNVKRRKSNVTSLPYVSSLDSAENVFLEVLLSSFTLAREPGKPGAHLEVAFDGSTPATWNRKGRGAVRKWIKDAFRTTSFRSKPSKADLYQQKLDAILFEEKPGTFAPSDERFLWRWASGGTLPVITIKRRSYYCLFFRDIFPIGWNIANGACDTRNELLDPLQALEREFAEELGVVNLKKRTRYVLNPEEHPALDRAEFTNYRRLWQEQFPELDIVNFKSEGLAFKWERGPDEVTIRTDNRANELTDCFVNINTLDFGIEIDRIARITATGDEVLCDMDVNDKKGRVLNRPVGLFEVTRLQRELRDGSDSFIPDKFFYSGKKFDGKEFKRLMKEAVSKDVRSWRTHKKLLPSSKPRINSTCVRSPAASFVDISLKVGRAYEAAKDPTSHSTCSLASVILTVIMLEKSLSSSRNGRVALPFSPPRFCPITLAIGGMLSTRPCSLLRY